MAHGERSSTPEPKAPITDQPTSDRTVGDYIPLLFPVGAVLAGISQILLWNTPAVEAFLLAFLVIVVGLQGIWAFLGHYFRPDEIAAFIGWPSGNPFQREVAFANLAFGTLGLLCVWFRGGFWIATALGISVFMLGAAFVHVKEIRETGNRSPGNAGPILWTDILTSLVLLVLLTLYVL
ncbi:DUF6790 family protein [Haladaptatus sp. DFWS20]|uniref:DUF6790 family protein n=1 Tax=Haladaptatus sp. DFWS20 TaxID=3403467 RepID=UPI003EB80B23